LFIASGPRQLSQLADASPAVSSAALSSWPQLSQLAVILPWLGAVEEEEGGGGRREEVGGRRLFAASRRLQQA